ncbi:methyltransferase domain-containing protein [Acidithrix sp. C25]|uniref:class I SAM-dependent methyltransferase n=1 Tax=Acidithrix sp. C25 TaxID=1671482 RepID=UPI00191BC346|nr:methyltransferase domain-containing protein [Acidithrix sp. C25]CAG4904912.1 unnamed protein product [Acidithrix sp. C25]
MQRGIENWSEFLTSFHQERAGITEDILSRSANQDLYPYRWLESALPASGRILDLCCGSAPILSSPTVAQSVVRIDRSLGELEVAKDHGRSGLVAADATKLPFRSDIFTGISISMALMLVEPLLGALDEIHRVLETKGYVTALLPGGFPLSLSDLNTYRMILSYHDASRQTYPNGRMSKKIVSLFTQRGFIMTLNQRKVFTFSFEKKSDALLFVKSLYIQSPNKQLEPLIDKVYAKAKVTIPLRLVGFRKVL